MNLSEDLIRHISKYNPFFSLVNKEYNQYYKKINKAAKIIQKCYKEYKMYKYCYCEICGQHHENFIRTPFFHSYNLDIPTSNSVQRYWNSEIDDLIDISMFNYIKQNYVKREKKLKKKNLIKKKQQIKK